MTRRLPPLALTFHGVADVPLARDPYRLFTSPRELERHIERLRGWGYRFVTAHELLVLAAGRQAHGAVALTFDDGFADNLHELVPVLERTGAKATVFIVSRWVGTVHPDAQAPMLTAGELRELHSRGVEIGGHSATHPDLTELSHAAAVSELREGRLALEGIVGVPVRVLAYPYGRSDTAVARAAGEAGYEGAYRTLGEGDPADIFDLPRQVMGNRSTAIGLRLKREGRYAALTRRGPLRALRGARLMALGMQAGALRGATLRAQAEQPRRPRREEGVVEESPDTEGRGGR